MLAYYVLWQMTEAWRPLLFADEDQEAKAVRQTVPMTTSSSFYSRASSGITRSGESWTRWIRGERCPSRATLTST